MQRVFVPASLPHDPQALHICISAALEMDAGRWRIVEVHFDVTDVRAAARQINGLGRGIVVLERRLPLPTPVQVDDLPRGGDDALVGALQESDSRACYHLEWTGEFRSPYVLENVGQSLR